MKIKIKVTKEILKRSVQCDGMKCAFALAVREFFPNAIVGLWELFPFGEHTTNEEQVLLPRSMQDFISVHDSIADKTVLNESTFELDLPQSVIDRIGISEVYKILSESKTLELVQI